MNQPQPSSSGAAMQTAAHPVVNERGFGTFSGVFTPSILTILGVIMYLRFGWVVGEAGLGQALLVVLVAHLITLSTGLSVSSIATNRTVRTGGAYYIISRSLGAPTGAAIGIPLFLAQALSVTFYVVGFTETLGYLWPQLLDPELMAQGITRLNGSGQAVAAGVCLLVGLLTFKGADIAIKTQYVVMAAIALSLVAFVLGRGENPPSEVTWWNNEGVGFGPIFAVFFPAVTGIMAGVGMSGDLKDPRKSLPNGTLLAIGVGFLVYMAIPFWLAVNADSDTLINDKEVFFKISAVPALIYAGVWGATLSSAIGSFLTAPRTLQALSFDRLAPGVFAKGYGPNQEPRAGVFFTFLLAEAGILIGGLDAIAALLTMFFLATYGFTNMACALERWAASPSFRPDFKVHWSISLTGGIACFYVMSYINLPAMIGAFVISGIIWVYVQRRSLEATWGDARHGIWAALVRTALYRLRHTDFHPENWRPNLLILGGGIKKRLHLLELGSSIVQDRGIVTYMHFLRGKVSDLAQERIELRRSLDEAIALRFPHVFCRVDIVEDLYKGVVDVTQSYGVGSFEANTVMLGWPKKAERREAYTSMLRDLVQLDRSLVLVNYDHRRRLGRAERISIWWGGLQQNGSFMLLLAYLLTAHFRWRNSTVEVLTVINDPAEREATTRAIQAIIESARLQAEPRVILREGREIVEIMKEHSAGSDLAIVGMRLPAADADPHPFFDRMDSMLEVLPTTLLVHSAQHFEGERLLFDSPNPQEGSSSASTSAGATQTPEGAADSSSPPPPATDNTVHDAERSMITPMDDIHEALEREAPSASSSRFTDLDAHLDPGSGDTVIPAPSVAPAPTEDPGTAPLSVARPPQLPKLSPQTSPKPTPAVSPDTEAKEPLEIELLPIKKDGNDES